MYKIVLLCFFFAFTVLHTSEEGYVVIPDRNTLTIKTPALQKQQTLKLRLNNGLEVLLISNPDANQSGAALAIESGYWLDPEKGKGVAHFLEHMLFLGTEKYPVESEYSSFIQKHGGNRNAYTSPTDTVYMFSIDTSVFSEALDRFSQFFISPLFNSSGIEREMQAVHQEFTMHANDDTMRSSFVEMELGNPEHPGSQFHIGCLETLKDISTQDLRKWFETHYSADIMHLVLYSSLSLEEMKDIVLKDFSPIPRRPVERLKIQVPLFGEATHGVKIYIVPKTDRKLLELSWELPSAFSELKDEKPWVLLGYVLGNEGQHSLLAQLKEEGLAEGLSTGTEQLPSYYCAYQLKVQLTHKGVKEIDTVIKRCFQALADLRQTGIPKSIFDEVQQMDRVSYQYQMRQEVFDMVTGYIQGMLDEDLSTFPMQSCLIQQFNQESIEELIEALSPENVHITILAKSELTGVQPDRCERWYGAEYAVRPIPQETIQVWKEAVAHPNIGLPVANPFIPQDLNLVCSSSEDVSNSMLSPAILAIDTPRLRLYYGQDDRYFVPKVVWVFYIKTQQTENFDIKIRLLLDHYVRSVDEALSSLSYPASCADLHYTFTNQGLGLALCLSGYNDKLDTLLIEILKILKDVRPSAEQFQVYHESLEQSLRDMHQDSPVDQALYKVKEILVEGTPSVDEELRVLRDISYEDFLAFIPSVFEKVYVEALCYGNLTKDSAIVVADKVVQQLGGQLLTESERLKDRRLWLPPNGPFVFTYPTDVRGSAAIEVIEEGVYTFEHRAAQEVLGSLIQEPFYDTLRTKQQTGYLVASAAKESEHQLYQMLAVQSSTYAARDLLARFDLFLEDFVKNIESNVPLKLFEDVKTAELMQLAHPPKNMLEMATVLNILAFEFKADFNFTQKRVEALQALTYAQFVEITKKFLGKKNRRRIAVLIEGRLEEEESYKYTEIEEKSDIQQKWHFLSRDDVIQKGDSCF